MGRTRRWTSGRPCHAGRAPRSDRPPWTRSPWPRCVGTSRPGNYASRDPRPRWRRAAPPIPQRGESGARSAGAPQHPASRSRPAQRDVGGQGFPVLRGGELIALGGQAVVRPGVGFGQQDPVIEVAQAEPRPPPGPGADLDAPPGGLRPGWPGLDGERRDQDTSQGRVGVLNLRPELPELGCDPGRRGGRP